MNRYKIIAGPVSCCVERNGVRSEFATLSASDGLEDVRRIAAGLYEAIFRIVAFKAWARHRMAMARARRCASFAVATMGKEWYAGPRPDLVATAPWKSAVKGQILSLSPAAAAMLVRIARAALEAALSDAEGE